MACRGVYFWGNSWSTSFHLFIFFGSGANWGLTPGLHCFRRAYPSQLKMRNVRVWILSNRWSPSINYRPSVSEILSLYIWDFHVWNFFSTHGIFSHVFSESTLYHDWTLPGWYELPRKGVRVGKFLFFVGPGWLFSWRYHALPGPAKTKICKLWHFLGKFWAPWKWPTKVQSWFLEPVVHALVPLA